MFGEALGVGDLSANQAIGNSQLRTASSILKGTLEYQNYAYNYAIDYYIAMREFCDKTKDTKDACIKTGLEALVKQGKA